jgi:3,4-dihydroxy 2-butanone 4-phosphate synthase/GTP cyclohydrolase II
MSSFRDSTEGKVHLALVLGDIHADEPCLVRVHVAASVRDLLGARLPDAAPGWNIRRCLERVASEGKGVVVLLASDEQSEDVIRDVDIALGNAPVHRPVADGSHNTHFTVGVGSQILRELGVGKMRLMGAPIKYNAISGFDLEVVSFEPA